MHSISHDILIIGAGIAGQRAALEASQAGLSVGIASKKHPLHSASILSSYINPLYLDWKKHSQNTLQEGQFLGNPAIIEKFSRETFQTVNEMQSWKKKEEEHFLHTLFNRLNKKNTTLYPYYFCLQLIIEEKKCKGAIFLDIEKGKIISIQSKATLLATGGCGKIFSRTTNDSASTGDGLALAFSAGIPLQDMEFIQFHPLGGEKGHIEKEKIEKNEFLTNIQNERFMKKYSPQKMEQAEHSTIVRGMMNEIKEGKGVGKERKQLFLNNGQRKKLVSPTMHYCLGGIPVDYYARVIADENGTIVQGLFAAGENACASIHGANRMEGNSILEGMVFGKIAGQAMSTYARENKEENNFSSLHRENAKERIEHLLSNAKGKRPFIVRESMQKMMMEKTGVLREKREFENGIRQWKKLFKESQEIIIEDKTKSFNTDLVEALETQNMVLVSQSILESALERKETRGHHIRMDYPRMDDKKWLKHTLFKRGNKKTKLFYKPILVNEKIKKKATIRE